MSDLLVFGKRAGEYAARFANGASEARVRDDDVRAASSDAVAPFERRESGDGGPYKVQHELQDTMQDLVGIVRSEDEMKRALACIGSLEERAERASVSGNREYNTGWHTALDLRHLLTISEAITRSAIERKESRGGHFREDYPDKDPAYGTFNIIVRKGGQGEMKLERVPIPPMPETLRGVIEEMK